MEWDLKGRTEKRLSVFVLALQARNIDCSFHAMIALSGCVCAMLVLDAFTACFLKDMYRTRVINTERKKLGSHSPKHTEC